MIVLIVAFAGCYHNFQPTELSVEEASGKEIISPTKCHLIAGSVVVFEKGFIVGGNVLTGYGVNPAESLRFFLMNYGLRKEYRKLISEFKDT